MTQLETVNGGEISYMGKVMVHTDENENAIYVPKKELNKFKQYFGLVFQKFELFPHFSVLQNIISAPVNVQKIPKEQAVETAKKLLEKMGLSDKIDAYPFQLSGGQQQRVAIARALALNPMILFFDEPTSALDPELTGEILKVIRELAKEHMTMVIVTHEMAFARDVADYIIFMDGGVIVESGNPNEVLRNPKNERTKAFLQRFSGTNGN